MDLGDLLVSCKDGHQASLGVGHIFLKALTAAVTYFSQSLSLNEEVTLHLFRSLLDSIHFASCHHMLCKDLDSATPFVYVLVETSRDVLLSVLYCFVMDNGVLL